MHTHTFSDLSATNEVTMPRRAEPELSLFVLGPQFVRIDDIPVHISPKGVSIFGYGLNLAPVLVELLQHIQTNAGFNLLAPVRKSDIRMAVSDINDEVRRALGELALPKDFRLIKPDAQRLVISKTSLDDIRQKVVKVRARKRGPSDEGITQSKNAPEISEEQNNSNVQQEENHARKGLLDDKRAAIIASKKEVAQSLLSTEDPKGEISEADAAKEIWSPILEKTIGLITDYKTKRKKYPDSWGAAPEKVGEYLLLFIEKMMSDGLQTMRGLPDEARKAFCASAFGAESWSAIERTTQRRLLTALTAMTVLDTGASLRSGSHEYNGVPFSQSALAGLGME